MCIFLQDCWTLIWHDNIQENPKTVNCSEIKYNKVDNFSKLTFWYEYNSGTKPNPKTSSHFWHIPDACVCVMATVLKLQERIEAELLSANFRLKSGLDTFTLLYRILLKFMCSRSRFTGADGFNPWFLRLFGYEIVSVF